MKPVELIAPFPPSLTGPPAIVYGDKRPPISNRTLGCLVDEQSDTHGPKIAVEFPQQGIQRTFHQIGQISKALASSLLSVGLRHGDRVGIMAGNRHEFLEVFMAAARIGCPAVLLQPGFSPEELRAAVLMSGCKILFMASRIGLKQTLQPYVDMLPFALHAGSQLQKIICMGDRHDLGENPGVSSYRNFLQLGISDCSGLESAQRVVQAENILCLAFTSGTTGQPKASMLTHRNIINNANYFAQACALQQSDIICSPLPLCHSFGLVAAFLASYLRGCTTVFPSESFIAHTVVKSILTYDITVLYGVPTMLFGVLEQLQRGHASCKPRNSLVKAVIGGAPSPYSLITRLYKEMNMQYILIGYGMTETSPATFITPLHTPAESDRVLRTIGKVMPHTNAKVVDRLGRTVKMGEKGELCVSGLPLQRGYWKNVKKTNEIMKRDADGVMWLHTGDECVIGHDGLCTITGRIKDIIIRGGVNISPAEIEERLTLHPSIHEASVIGLPDERYGERVACFLKQGGDLEIGPPGRPSDEAIRTWVRDALGRHKAPEVIFWIGDQGTGEDFPKTGSGKHQKQKMKQIGRRLLKL